MVWHAVYVNSRAEKKTAETLEGRGFEAYVPLQKTMRQWSDRKKMVELPLLKGYVFIHMLPNQQEKVLQTRGVVNFVRSEGKTAVIRDHEIERLKQLVDLGYHMEADVIRRNYSEGDKVKIRSGVLKGLEGFVYSKGDQKLIEVVLTSIGQCIRIKLPKELLQEI